MKYYLCISCSYIEIVHYLLSVISFTVYFCLFYVLLLYVYYYLYTVALFHAFLYYCFVYDKCYIHIGGFMKCWIKLTN